MPYLPTAAAWLAQSSLLLQARPSTTKITTRYAHPKKKKSVSSPNTTDATAPTKPPKPPKPAILVLKTYDPASGTCLKYKTDKAAEVGRLVASLGRAGRIMAGLPAGEDTITGDAPTAMATTTTTREEGRGANAPVPEASKSTQAEGKGKETTGGGGGGKKKKGRGKGK